MSKVTIHLGTRRILREVFFLGDAEKMAMIREELPHYTVGGTFETELTGEDAAEEAFDLTNNPCRQDERETKYGRGRSVSSGDVIEVDGVKYVCMSVGWEIL
jgi:hypothetical protein